MFTKKVRAGTGIATAPIYRTVINWDAVWGWIVIVGFTLVMIAACNG